ncbi:hypothetical protein IJ579_08070 [bacterium]|nr:hypothetical protein [bacterium]
MSEQLKKLTGKNAKEFEPIAFELVNKPDVKLFEELVSQEDFLFDFVKQNVASRLSKYCNEVNYKNLLQLLKFYSPFYEEFIVSTLAKYANEDLTDEMLNLLENGNRNEKTYSAKFFSYIQDPLSIDLLKANAYDENTFLSYNCASTLALLGDRTCYNQALEKLKSEDDFEVLNAVKFLVSYGDKNAVDNILDVMRTSAVAENIAVEIPYLVNMTDFAITNDGLFVLNLIINGLGEISSLAQVFDFHLYEIFEKLLNNPNAAVVILNAYDKFNTLTENDEYLYDETKDVKQEIFDIKKLIGNTNINKLKTLVEQEINQDSQFVFTALDFTQNADKVRKLLNSTNQTLILKSLEILKKLGAMTQKDKELAIKNITNENIRNIVLAM